MSDVCFFRVVDALIVENMDLAIAGKRRQTFLFISFTGGEINDPNKAYVGIKSFFGSRKFVYNDVVYFDAALSADELRTVIGAVASESEKRKWLELVLRHSLFIPTDQKTAISRSDTTWGKVLYPI